MGVVYEALDAARAGRVALKTLIRCGAHELYRLKNEFRSLADVAHPNLVALHEFVRDGDVWFFTMDLLAGDDFLSYVRGNEVMELARTRDAAESDFDEVRLRDALRQLVEGVVALHRAGKLHSDLKPGNVTVSKTGRLTILDFGLVSERAGPSTGRTLGDEWAGTPGYMAPEQMEAGELSPASDYYAIGVMLYEGLTGRLPFRATHGSLLRRSSEFPFPMPSHLTSGSTADLAELCLELLSFDPGRRPSEQSLLDRVCRSTSSSPRASVPRFTASASFVGREAPLQQLLAIRAGLASSRPEAVLIRGPSGIGKTRLAHEFLGRCQEQGDCLILQGRCYERESVPYNAFDSLVDALSRYLRRLPEVRAATLMPRDAQVLAELFPVLRRVGSIETMPAPVSMPSEPSMLRRRAFDALKELLSRISDLSPIVMCIDDVQWADADSLQLLEAIVSEPSAPRTLLLGLHLDDHQGSAASIAALCERQRVRLNEIALAPLAETASLQMIAEKLSLPEAEAQRMARDAHGNPFFLGELIDAGRGNHSAASDLRQVILERAARLSPSMRALLDLLCIASAPIQLGVGLQAVGLAEQGQVIVTELRNERWLRLDPAGKTQRVEIYHDRIRGVLFDALGSDARRQLYHRLAECLEAGPVVDEEVVASYWLKAGSSERAAVGFARAALRAEKNLAFGSAGRLYGLALEHGHFGRDEERRLRLGRAAALERAGYALGAAQAYLDAANEHEQREDTLALRRSAAQLLLTSGSLEAGTEVLRAVLSEVGLDYPERTDQARAQLEAAREQLRERGLAAAAPHAEEHESGAELWRQADACWAAGSTLGPYDFVRAGYFATRGLCLALDTGDPLRIARALSMYATSVASGGDTGLARQLAERSLALASSANDDIVFANAHLAAGQVSLFAGDFDECLGASDRALAMFRNANAGASQEVHICNMFANMALHMSGRLEELVARSRQQLIEARACGHIQAEASLRVLGVALGHLANDEVGLARKEGDVSARLWPQGQLHGERFKVLRLEVWCDLFEGSGLRAWDRFAEARRQNGESVLLSSRYWSFWWFDLAASTALGAAACAPDGPTRAALLAEAELAMAELDGMEPKYVGSQLTLYRTARAHLVGDTPATLDGLRALCRVSHPILAACAQAKLGELVGGPEGAALHNIGVLSLQRWVRSPERWVAFMLPGFRARNVDAAAAEDVRA
jgi:hypothetical protein